MQPKTVTTFGRPDIRCHDAPHTHWWQATLFSCSLLCGVASTMDYHWDCFHLLRPLSYSHVCLLISDLSCMSCGFHLLLSHSIPSTAIVGFTLLEPLAVLLEALQSPCVYVYKDMYEDQGLLSWFSWPLRIYSSFCLFSCLVSLWLQSVISHLMDIVAFTAVQVHYIALLHSCSYAPHLVASQYSQHMITPSAQVGLCALHQMCKYFVHDAKDCCKRKKGNDSNGRNNKKFKATDKKETRIIAEETTSSMNVAEELITYARSQNLLMPSPFPHCL